MPVTISGTTGVDLIKDGTVVQADLGVNVAGTGPAFSAYPSIAQSISTAFAKIAWQNKEFDPTSAFDAVTNYRFQPTVPGYYLVSGSVYFGNVSTLTVVAIYKNGAEARRGMQVAGAGATNNSIVSALIQFNGSTDYVELWASSASTQNTNPASFLSYFQGYLARSA